MKKLLLIIGSVLISASFTNAQNTVDDNNAVIPKRHCATMEHRKALEALDPGYTHKLQQLEEQTQEWIKNNPNYEQKTVVTIPVVVHVVYKTTAQAISLTRVQEQIDILNIDYAGLNTNGNMGAFASSLKANTELQFCLATKDPNGSPTTGVEYKQTTVTSWTYDDMVKYSSNGGADQWNPNKYMNIWVCVLGGGLCGYAEFPVTGLSNTYGVVIHYQYFGKTGASAPYNKGGTTTHEIGHCFNLYHIWGDESGCSGSDYCNDTPNQASENYDCPTGVLTDACATTSPGFMYMNFMDYTEDACYHNFTPNQKARIQACFATGPLKNLGTANSTYSLCSNAAVNDIINDKEIKLFPNPTNNEFTIDFSGYEKTDVNIDVYNMIGEHIKSITYDGTTDKMTINISSENSGIYIVNIQTTEGNVIRRISLLK
ncbi:MAG TPA: M43 family zinc metalloprotease [Bacteroidales bacterium]|nr:M43 family zinc metalloprotease [Bacteroidales bacterium]HPS15927.1 M43 family zinc metalloprotease [Bacteroidales bacterium]